MNINLKDIYDIEDLIPFFQKIKYAVRDIQLGMVFEARTVKDDKLSSFIFNSVDNERKYYKLRHAYRYMDGISESQYVDLIKWNEENK